MKEEKYNYKYFSSVKNYTGYLNNHSLKIDEVIYCIEPKTHCWEFFQHYWYLISLTSVVRNKPKSFKILGH